ncbi:hypothetical protein EDD16DRAFT_29845 [Pisolithus croceorrhizus]|nr:hypothetical protein EDD16DRAFT_29845 [Pisolithus croceorrhizus]
MALLTTITGFSLFGLASAVRAAGHTETQPHGQSRRYMSSQWPRSVMQVIGPTCTKRVPGEYLTTKRAEIAERRERKLEAREEAVQSGGYSGITGPVARSGFRRRKRH